MNQHGPSNFNTHCMEPYAPTENDRQLLVANLNGYLNAIASINGKFREYVASATLVAIEPNGIEAAVRGHLSKWQRPLALTEFRPG